MYKTLLTSIFLIMASYSTASSADMTEKVKQALEAWQPTEVQYSDNNLIVILPQRQITNEIYKGSMTWLCVMSSVNRVDLGGVNQIAVLNMFGRQGLVFEGGKRQCEKISNAPSNKVDVLLLDNTHFYTN